MTFCLYVYLQSCLSRSIHLWGSEELLCPRRILNARIRKHLRQLHIPVHYHEDFGKKCKLFEAIVACVGIHFRPDEVRELKANPHVQLQLNRNMTKWRPEYAKFAPSKHHHGKETVGDIEWAAHVMQRLVRRFLIRRRRERKALTTLIKVFRYKQALRKFKYNVNATIIQRSYRSYLARSHAYNRFRLEALLKTQALETSNAKGTGDRANVGIMNYLPDAVQTSETAKIHAKQPKKMWQPWMR